MPNKKSDERSKRNLKTRSRLWPDLKDEMVWSWKTSDGYVAIPRAMPIFFIIMDICSKSKPLSSTYFALWCKCWDETGLIKINNPTNLAGESGFSGQRAVTTWKKRMQILEKLGFIITKKHGIQDYGYVVILNPYKIVKNLYKEGKFKDNGWYNALFERAEEIKATDLDD